MSGHEIPQPQEFKGTPIKRGLYTESGVQIISTPTIAQLESLPVDPRVEYFTTLGDQPQFISDEVDPEYKERLDQTNSPYFLKHCINPLSNKIRSALEPLSSAGKYNVGMRGTACSLNGPLECKMNLPYQGKAVIRDVEQIIKEGSDSGSEETKIIPTDLRDLQIIEGYPSMYLHFYPRMFRYNLRINNIADDAVFPLLLIYDLKSVKGKENVIRLPKSLEDRSKTIIKAFILDYPMF